MTNNEMKKSRRLAAINGILDDYSNPFGFAYALHEYQQKLGLTTYRLARDKESQASCGFASDIDDIIGYVAQLQTICDSFMRNLLVFRKSFVSPESDIETETENAVAVASF